jgi:U3 small nucleolar RNA-associated protein 14
VGQLEDLKASLVDLSDEDLLEMVRETRKNRRVSKKKATVKKKTQKKAKESIEQVMAKMSDEEREALLSKMKERLAGGKK